TAWRTCSGVSTGQTSTRNPRSCASRTNSAVAAESRTSTRPAPSSAARSSTAVVASLLISPTHTSGSSCTRRPTLPSSNEVGANRAIASGRSRSTAIIGSIARGSLISACSDPVVASSTSAKVGTCAPSPASSRRISSKVSSETSPVPSVVRSTVASWTTTTWPSRVARRSSSSSFTPISRAVRNEGRVFSGTRVQAPRWPTTKVFTSTPAMGGRDGRPGSAVPLVVAVLDLLGGVAQLVRDRGEHRLHVLALVGEDLLDAGHHCVGAVWHHGDEGVLRLGPVKLVRGNREVRVVSEDFGELGLVDSLLDHREVPGAEGPGG